jgi:hypothetical protein
MPDPGFQMPDKRTRPDFQAVGSMVFPPPLPLRKKIFTLRGDSPTLAAL